MSFLLLASLTLLQTQEPDCACGHSESPLAQMEAEMVSLHESLSPILLRVQLEVDAIDDSGNPIPGQLSQSGVLLSPSGLFVSPTPPNANIDVAKVTLASGENRQAKLIRSDPQLGMSLYKCDAINVKAPQFASCGDLKPGVVAITMGNSFGMESTLDLGYVTGTQRCVAGCSGLLQLTNTVNPGDGGGLVADRKGRVMGVLKTSLREAALHEQKRTGNLDSLGMTRSESISFAIPSDRILRSFAKELGLPSGMARPRLGVMVEKNQDGELMVVQVLPGSAAAEAGLKKGDILIKLDDVELSSLERLMEAILSSKPQTKIILRRDGKNYPVKVELRF